MSTELNLENKFTKVSYKRKGKTKNTFKKNLNISFGSDISDDLFDLESNIGRVTRAKEELLTTDLYQSVSALLKEGFSYISHPKVTRIICYGLGRISESTIPRYQLALLLCLKNLLRAEVEAFDPVFNKNDLVLLEHFQINTKRSNTEGKYKVNVETVLFYLPHCPKQLTNNLLWSNWGLNLSKCIIIGNSINRIIEDNSKVALSKSAEYISKICPYVLELGIVNGFKLFEVFNDTSIHFFPLNRINILPGDFWREQQEPEYSDDDVEFIRKSVENKLKL